MIQCLNCCRKHIAKAEVYIAQWLFGYPNDKWFAIGELCHAEEHTMHEFPSLSRLINETRKRIEADEAVDLTDLMAEACSLSDGTAFGELDFSESMPIDSITPKLWAEKIIHGDIQPYQNAFIKSMSKSIDDEIVNIIKHDPAEVTDKVVKIINENAINKWQILRDELESKGYVVVADGIFTVILYYDEEIIGGDITDAEIRRAVHEFETVCPISFPKLMEQGYKIHSHDLDGLPEQITIEKNGIIWYSGSEYDDSAIKEALGLC